MAHAESEVSSAGYFQRDDKKFNLKNDQLWLDIYRSLMVFVVFVPSAVLKPNLAIVWIGYLPYLLLSLFMVFLTWKGILNRIRFWTFLLLDSIVINIFAYVIGIGLVPIGIGMIPVVVVYTTAGGKKEGLISCIALLVSFALVMLLEEFGLLDPMVFVDKALPEFTNPGGPLGAWLIVSGVLMIIHLWIAMVMKNLNAYNSQIFQAYNEEQAVLKRSAKLSRALRQTEKLEGFGKLAGSVAHDFNSLLTVIKGFTEEVRENKSSETSLAGDLLEITKAATRAGELTSQLLAFSRRQDVEAQPTEINQLIHGFQRLLSPIIGEDISVSVQLSRAPLWVNGDQKRIEQLLMALAINSKEAMPDGGEISIETKIRSFTELETNRPPSVPSGEYVEIVFTDNGIGMSQDVHSRAFEPFFTTKTQGEGCGLGLSVGYGIARQHGGEILAETSPGKGTVIRLFLPRIPEWSGVDI